MWQWTTQALILVKSSPMSPPAVARALAILGACMYEAESLFHSNWSPLFTYAPSHMHACSAKPCLQPFSVMHDLDPNQMKPLLEIPTQQTFCRNESKWQSQSTVTINEAANAAISGAATKALTNLFPAANQTKQIMSFLQATKDSKGMLHAAFHCYWTLMCLDFNAMSWHGISSQCMRLPGYHGWDLEKKFMLLRVATGAAFNLGEKACGACILARAEDGSNQYGKDYNSISSSPYADTTNYFPVNPPQMVPGITECG